ncbi:MAG TPA: hypothetical protein VFU44_08650 [Candidatus Limnocylindria bacterium]|nr:hypothetical protein [Candidatus Limnocylindria bacterium]
MYRRNLILRRFGALSFGLGYFEDGVWIDHAPGDGLVSDTDADMQTIHAWLGCCSAGADSVATPVWLGPELSERIAVLARSASS